MNDHALFHYYNGCKQIFEEIRSRFPITVDVQNI